MSNGNRILSMYMYRRGVKSGDFGQKREKQPTMIKTPKNCYIFTCPHDLKPLAVTFLVVLRPSKGQCEHFFLLKQKFICIW